MGISKSISVYDSDDKIIDVNGDDNKDATIFDTQVAAKIYKYMKFATRCEHFTWQKNFQQSNLNIKGVEGIN